MCKHFADADAAELTASAVSVSRGHHHQIIGKGGQRQNHAAGGLGLGKGDGLGGEPPRCLAALAAKELDGHWIGGVGGR